MSTKSSIYYGGDPGRDGFHIYEDVNDEPRGALYIDCHKGPLADTDGFEISVTLTPEMVEAIVAHFARRAPP